MVSGNKGEWSELYAFFRLLADGKLYSGDGETNIYEDKFYPILKIFRDDSKDRISYCIDTENQCVTFDSNSISQSEFNSEAQYLLSFIKSLKGTEGDEHIEAFMNKIGCYTIKAKSADKADIRIVIHNLTTGIKPELGYSIKSKLGGNSTLLNANKDGSNFLYKINGFPLSINKINEFNSLDKFKKKKNFLDEYGANLSFENVVSSVFNSNLQLLDFCMPKLIAEALKLYYFGGINKISDVVEKLKELNPLSFPNGSHPLIYEYKIKQFLLNFALGMTPSTLWDGKYNANGGYIVVKENGDVVCYHFFDRNDLEDYLFKNTFFDTPSTSRHEFGKIEMKGDELFIKLNIQVRFNA